MAFCINCGKQLPEGAKFCLECGTPVAVLPAAAPAPEPAPTPAPEPTPVVENIPEPVIEPVVAPEPKPEPEPIPEPIPAPVSESEPVQQSTPVPAMQFTQVQSEDADNDLNMEGPPIVGNYSIPGMENASQQPYIVPTPQPPKAAKPAGAPKQSTQGAGKFGFVMMIIVGALVVLAIIVGIITMIVDKAGSSSTKKSTSSGTALTELLDNAAATHYNGGGSSNTSLKDEPDENYVDEEDDEEELLDASSADEKLFQGCMYATLPAGFVQGGSDGTSEEEFYREDNDDCKIKLHVSSGGRAREKAEEDVQWWIDSGKGEGYEIVDDIDAGEYTWTVEHFPFNNENSSAKFYADVDDKYHLEVVCFMMNETDPDVIAFLESIHMADGDPGKLRSEWLDSRNK